MADRRPRMHSPAPQQVHKSNLDHSAQRLAKLGEADAGIIRLLKLFNTIPLTTQRLQVRLRLEHALLKLRILQQLDTHGRPLGSLAGKDKGEVGPLARAALRPDETLGQLVRQRLEGRRDAETPKVKVGSAVRKGIGQVEEVLVLLAVQTRRGQGLAVRLGQTLQPALVPGAEDEEPLGGQFGLGDGGGGPGTDAGLGVAVVFVGDGAVVADEAAAGEVVVGVVEDGVGVGAAEAERVDADAALAPRRPLHRLGRQDQVPRVELESRVDGLDAVRRDQLAFFQASDGFEDAGEAGAAFGVADVGLDAADVKGAQAG